MLESLDQMPGGILAVIVLYECSPLNSATFRTLRASMQSSPNSPLTRILFYDNTPGGSPGVTIPTSAMYESHGTNRGLAVAYNRALKIAGENECEWLLTLDQDTHLPLDFVAKLASATAYVHALDYVGAIVPQLWGGERLISPNVFRFRIFPRPLTQESTGVAFNETVYALNSATTVRVSALQAIGGYDPMFCMDYSDTVMCHRLQKAGFRIFIAGNILVKHDLSVLDLQKKVSMQRYEEILGAESAFWDEYMGGIAGFALVMRFAFRILWKFCNIRGNLPYSRINARFLWRRLTHSRERRIRLWQETLRRRFSSPD